MFSARKALPRLFLGQAWKKSPLQQESLYDIVIVGGGIAGTALACALTSNPVLKNQRVALVEAMDLAPTKAWTPVDHQYSNRVVSLTPGSLQFLERTGVASYLDPTRVYKYGDMEVWDGVTGARITFDTDLLDSHDHNEKQTIASMVENVHLQSAMLKRLEASPSVGAHIDIFQNTRVSSITNESSSGQLNLSDWPTVTLDKGNILKARLLVGADGIQSPVRNYAGIDSLGWDYDSHGIVATLQLDPSRSQQKAWQRFLPTGPIAMLPLGEGYASLVWSVPTELASTLKGVSSEDFCSLVNAAFRMTPSELSYLYSTFKKDTFQSTCDIAAEYIWREQTTLAALDSDGEWKREISLPPTVTKLSEKSRASFPLRMRNSEHYMTDRVALVGDAAHTIHPLAGQGLNQGLLDVACLSRVLESGVLHGQDIGSINLLRDYSTERYGRNILMLSSCDKMHRLFGTDILPITWIRSLGLSAVNSLDGLKAEIMRYAMGIESQK
ncbi:hypothetical protein BDF14DRAFT_1798957 [Spinellus fusiger]|nr:hypothetical protein BDF14DRAFT_1798957 [Spinellus fusiger]